MPCNANTVLFSRRCPACVSHQVQHNSIRTYANIKPGPLRMDTSKPTPPNPDLSRSSSSAFLRKPQIQAHVSPVSPRFLPVPPSKQANSEPPPRIRGILPMPRNIFHSKRGGSARYTDAYFARLTKPSASTASRQTLTDETVDPQAARSAWRARLSDLRRRNLVEGVRELQTKRRSTARLQHRAAAARKAHRRQLREEREARQDERLTRPTTPMSMADPLRAARVPDPERGERVAAMQARVMAVQEIKVAERKDALHTLYMHAREFITTEAQLDSAIESAFGTPQEPRTWGNDGVSVWSKGNPESIYERLTRANQKRDSFQESQGFAELSNKRMKRIAEALTGGKI